MARNRINSLTLFLGVALGAALLSEPAWGATITLSGAINTDDAVQLFDVTVAAPTTVDLRSYGYAGGVIPDDSGITVVPSGGFDTVLTLFSASGSFVSENDDGAGVATDPSTGLAADARVTANLTAGSYILALTQYDNFANGANLADGFVETGNPNFTADPSFATRGPCPGNMFRDISGTAGRCRNGNWTVDFANVASVTPRTPVPEPLSGPLFALGLGIAFLLTYLSGRIVRFRQNAKPYRFPRRRAKGCLERRGFRHVGCLKVWRPLLLISLFSALTLAQNPDYSKVNDYLNGQRTLLSVNDLVVGGLVLKTDNGTKIPPENISTLPGVYGKDNKQSAELFARMFDLPYDTLIYAEYADSGELTVHALDPQHPQINKSVATGIAELLGAMAKGDFEGNGFEDVVLVIGDNLRIVKAVDPTDVSKGILVGPGVELDSSLLGDSPGIAVGDFNGDGRPEIAVSYTKYSEHDNANTYVVAIYTVDRTTLALTLAGSNQVHCCVDEKVFYYKGALTAGRFGTTLHDQLVLAYYFDSSSSKFRPLPFEIMSFDFDKSLSILKKADVSLKLDGSPLQHNATDIVLQKGHFDPSSPYDQAALKFDKHLGILYFDTALQIHVPTFTDPGGYGCNNGMAVGSFARTDPNPQDPVKTQASLKSQIAITSTFPPDCKGSLGIHIFNVDPPPALGKDFLIDPNQAFFEELADPSQAQFYGYSVVSGDVQGRSLVLGEPAKVVLNGAIQPKTIVALPPMHIDFQQPNPRSPDPKDKNATILNVSGVPDSFYTKYSTEDSSKSGTTDTHDNGWSFSAKESIGGSVEFGSVDRGEGTKFSEQFTATQNLNHTYGNTHGTFTNYTYGVVQQTGYDDQVWFTQTRFNIWVYPVIGQTACPAKIKNCSASDLAPLNVQFSGPDQMNAESQIGNLLAWYQPPWEPFNLLSYPGSYSQLKQIVPDIAKLSTDSTFHTDSSTATLTSTWETGANTEQSAGYDRTFSEENDLSVVAAGDAGIFSVGLNAEVSLGGSDSFHDLSQGTTALSKSTGITINKPGTFAEPFLYGYDFTPYIFGQTQPGGFVNGQPLTTDISTFGMLRTAFVVNPTTSGSGGWWTAAYGSKPDVALNHPLKWSLDLEPQKTPLPANCLAVGSENQMDCAVQSASNPADPWNSQFQIMRGFFISDSKPTDPTSLVKGSLLETAKPGTVLALQTRVYNFSLKTMPVDTVVHVRFYAQPWDAVAKAPLAGKPSFLVGEDKLGPIAPFSSTDGAPLNWVYANASFDTSSYANQYFAFWVVVWMEDGNGNLVPEIDGHGLKAIPGTLTSLSDVNDEKFDNNVGFFRLAFYVFPKSDGLGTVPGNNPGDINVGKVQLSEVFPAQGATVAVSAMLSAGDAGVAGANAVFYDGDPDSGGQPFGVDRASYVRPNDEYKVSSMFRANACGPHQLFVVVNKGQSNEAVRRAPTVIVKCDGSQALGRAAGVR